MQMILSCTNWKDEREKAYDVKLIGIDIQTHRRQF